MARHLFAYGSLCAPAVFALVTGLRRRAEPATLARHRAVRVRGQAYPMLERVRARDPGQGDLQGGAPLAGRLYRHLPASAWRRLDAFEGAWYRRRRVTVAPAGTDGAARVMALTYGRVPTARLRLADEDWQLEPFLRLHAQAFTRYWRDRLRRPGRQSGALTCVASNAGRARRSSRARKATATPGAARSCA